MATLPQPSAALLRMFYCADHFKLIILLCDELTQLVITHKPVISFLFMSFADHLVVGNQSDIVYLYKFTKQCTVYL